MAKQTINTGAAIDDPSAESVRSAFTKVNAMTLELFTAFSLGGRAVIDLDASPDSIRDAFVKTNANLSALYTSQSLPGVPVIDVGDAPDDPSAATIYAAFTTINAAMGVVYAAVEPPVTAADYYTATTGNDANAGTLASPFRTIAKGASLLGPGKTLLVRAGTYAETLINNVPAGTSWSSKVRIAAYPGETVWLKPASATHVVNFYTTQRYIELDGINIDGIAATASCVKIEEWSGGQAHHIRITNATLKGLNNAVSGHNNLVIVTALRAGAIGSNEFINLTMFRSSTVTTWNTNGFYIQSPNNLIERCNLSNLRGFGMQAYNGNVDPITLPDTNTVRYNVFHDFPLSDTRNWAINIGRGTGNKIYGNLVYNIRSSTAGAAAIYLFVGASTEVYNNTVYASDQAGLVIEAGVTNSLVRNNIAYQNAGGNYVNRGTNTTASNNLFGVNPMFVDASSANFRLQAGSPGIDAGASIALVGSDIRHVATTRLGP